MKTIRAQQIGTLLAAMAILTGCAVFPVTDNNTTLQTYLLQGVSNTRTVVARVAANDPVCLTLRITKPGSSSGYLTARMAYIDSPSRLNHFAYHEWVDTPASMLASIVEQRLESERIFKSVLSSSTDIKTDWRLDSNIVALYQDFTTDALSQLVFKVKVSLVDLRNRSLLDTHTFHYVVVATANNAEAGVAAANEAVEIFMAELTEFVWRQVTASECIRSS